MSIGEIGAVLDSIANLGGLIVSLVALIYAVRSPRP